MKILLKWAKVHENDEEDQFKMEENTDGCYQFTTMKGVEDEVAFPESILSFTEHLTCDNEAVDVLEGGVDSGTYMHTDQVAELESLILVCSGLKYVQLFPPETRKDVLKKYQSKFQRQAYLRGPNVYTKDFFPDGSGSSKVCCKSADSYTSNLRNDGGYSVVMMKGMGLWFPPLWYHQVRNLRKYTIAIAYFYSPMRCLSLIAMSLKNNSYDSALITRKQMVMKVMVVMEVLVNSEIELSFADVGNVIDVLVVLRDAPSLKRFHQRIESMMHRMKKKLLTKFASLFDQC